MILIYTPKLTGRIKYTFKLVFYEFLLLKTFQLTTEKQEYLDFKGPKFSYSPQKIDEGLHFSSSGLLSEIGIKEQDVKFSNKNSFPVLYSLSKESALDFDVFAAVFFMLVRYEEYLPHQRDKYDRFEPTTSIAFQHGFLKTAVVDRWMIKLREVLKQHFPSLDFGTKKYQYIPT